jgi:hypothetical protein
MFFRILFTFLILLNSNFSNSAVGDICTNGFHMTFLSPFSITFWPDPTPIGVIALALQNGFTCSHTNSGKLIGCTNTDGNGAGEIRYSQGTQCLPPPEQENCLDKKSTGALIWLLSSSPKVCGTGCTLNKVSAQSPFIGTHQTSTSLNSVYIYDGTNCDSSDGYPEIDPASETGAGESCNEENGFRICNTPDVDGDGAPEMPPLEVNEGCMSVTNITTGNTNVVCGEPEGDNGFNDGETCGITPDGTYGCYPDNECTFKNGNPVCLDSSGNYVGTDSPDNPLNGGNLDGNNSNDILDSESTILSPALTDDQLINNSNASNLLTEDLAPYLINIDNSVKTNGEKVDASNVLLTSIASGITQLNTGGGSGDNSDLIENVTPTEASDMVTGLEFDNIDFTEYVGDPESGVGLGNTFGGDNFTLDGQITGLLPSVSACSDLRMEVKGITMLNLTCASMNTIRNLLSWVIYFMLVVHIFNVITMERK